MKQIVPGWRLVCILPPTITPNPEIWLLVATSIAPGMAHPWKHGGSYPTLLPARSSREPQWWRNGKHDGTTTIENHKNPFFRRFAFTSAQFPEQNKSKRCDWVSFWPSSVLGRTATATGATRPFTCAPGEDGSSAPVSRDRASPFPVGFLALNANRACHAKHKAKPREPNNALRHTAAG